MSSEFEFGHATGAEFPHAFRRIGPSTSIEGYNASLDAAAAIDLTSEAVDELQEIRRGIVSTRDARDDSDPFAGV